MNYERLKELDDRFNAVDEQVKALSKQIEQLEKELAGAKGEPGFERVVHGEQYYHIGLDYVVCTCPLSDTNSYYNKMDYDNNNYFYTKERAQEVADKIRLLLKLERLHDIYCPNYKPSSRDKDKRTYYIYKDNSSGKYTSWEYGVLTVTRNAVEVYFPTKEIAQKVCDILNAELKQDSAN